MIALLATACNGKSKVQQNTQTANPPTQQQTTQTQQTTPNPTNEPTGWKVYTNTQFGFQLTFTDAWEGYKVFSSEGSQGVGAPTYLAFSLPTADKSSSVNNVTDNISGYAAPFTITIIAKDRAYQGTSARITQDSNNVYYYNTNKNLPKDLQGKNFEIPKIISTFKFTNTTTQNQPQQDNNSAINSSVPNKPTLTFLPGAKPSVQINFDYSIAKKFNIYRSVITTGGWRLIIPNFPANAHTAVDYSFPNNCSATFYYRVTPVDDSGKEVTPSKTVSILVPTAASWPTYTNTDTGFQLTLTDAWKGYGTSFEPGFKDFMAGTVKFYVPVTPKAWDDALCSEVFDIIVYRPSYWDKTFAENGVSEDEPKVITRTPDWVYTYVKNNPSGNLKTPFDDIPKIIASFKLTK